MKKSAIVEVCISGHLIMIDGYLQIYKWLIQFQYQGSWGFYIAVICLVTEKYLLRPWTENVIASDSSDKPLSILL